MKCPYCGKEFTSEKIFGIHTRKCVTVKQDSPPLEKEQEQGKGTNKTTQRKQRQKRDAK
jgi:hypothetical protein